MTRIEGSVAVVTGAGSGIGRALAHALVARGCPVALADVHPARVDAVAGECVDRGGAVLAAALDVADAEAVGRFAEQVLDRFGRVELVLNNAGVALTAEATDQTLDEVRRVIDVNLWGVIHGCQVFLPHLLAGGRGHLVNISSLFGLLAAPGQSAYVASKFGVRGYSEALAVELAMAGAPVRVSTVHPGGVATNIARDGAVGSRGDAAVLQATFDALARTSPERAAAAILRGVERDRQRILVGGDARAFNALLTLLGSRYIPFVAWYTRRRYPEAAAMLRRKEASAAGAPAVTAATRPAAPRRP